MRPLFIQGQWGLGDNIYARPFVKMLCKSWDVYIDTPWPEIYEDLPVKFVRQPRKLRTQMKNLQRQRDNRWSTIPRGAITRRINYHAADLPGMSIPQALAARFDAKADWANWDLPQWDYGPIDSDLPIAVVKATTERKEWKSRARNPKPEYVNWIAEQLMATHNVVAVADLADGEEWLVGEAPPAQVSYLKGDLTVEQLIALVRRADIIVGSVGWNVPMSIALKVKSFVVLGGRGAHNAPEIITHPGMDLRRLGFAKPDKYCRCSSALHDCPKSISNLAEQWADYCAAVGISRLSAKMASSPGIQLASATIQ